MQNILEKDHNRKNFYLVVLSILIIASIIRFFVLPYFEDSLKVSWLQFFALLLDSLVISLFITVLIGSFIFWFTPSIMKISVMDVLEPKEIGPLLKKANSDSKLWIYKGSCGRYMRAVTLPEMAEAARKEGLGRDITILLINPENKKLCEEYANYRRSLKSSKINEWTIQKVQQEVISTIISALKYSYEEPQLKIDIYLVNHFSAFRLDISDHYVIVTKEDKEATGLRADSGTYFYNSYKDDVRLTERQSKRVNFSSKVPSGSNLTGDKVKKLIVDAEILSESNLSNIDISQIVKNVNNPVDPYA